jgi:hypothetical protein
VILRVVSIDDEAARLLALPAAWTLHARFERSLILSRVPDGALVTLVRNDLSDGPYAARLARDAPRDLRSVAAVPTVDRAGASRWEPRLVPPAEAVDARTLARRFRLLDEVAARAEEIAASAAGRRGGRGIDAVADPSDLAALETAIADGDAGAATEVAARLAGLGPGLTPSGDDLLCGAMACLAWAESAGLDKTPGDGAALRLAIASTAAPRTSRFAAQALTAATRGHVAAPLASLLGSLFRHVATVPPDIAPLLAIGETSGHDLLGGVRLAGRALGRAMDASVLVNPTPAGPS